MAASPIEYPVGAGLPKVLRRRVRDIPLRALRNPGAVVKSLAEAGETARVTDRGRLVAWLVPATPEERRYDELVAAGVIVPPKNPDGLSGWHPLPAIPGLRPLSEVLQEMREEDRT